MNKIRKICCVMLALFVMCNCILMVDCNQVFAETITEENAIECFSKMSDEQLNAYIHSVAVSSSKKRATLSNNSISTYASSNGKSITWLAAAQILINNGYVCAGTLLQAAANQVTKYTESNGGIFENAITSTSKYTSFLKKAKGKSSYSTTIEYEDDVDLFLSLHKCNFTSKGIAVGTNFASYNIHVSDVYDFKLEWKDSSYKSMFVSLVNDAAWLSTQTGTLSTYPVNIYFLDK